MSDNGDSTLPPTEFVSIERQTTSDLSINVESEAVAETERCSPSSFRPPSESQLKTLLTIPGALGPLSPALRPQSEDLSTPSRIVTDSNDTLIKFESNEKEETNNNERDGVFLQRVQPLISRAANFLATGSPEALGSVCVGIAAVLYLLLGNLGLLLIGILLGLMGHAALETKVDNYKQPQWRKEKFVGVVDLCADGITKKETIKSSRRTDLATANPETALAIEELASAVVRDYVASWYTPVLPCEENFPNSCREFFLNTIFNIHGHLFQKRSGDVFLLFIVSTSSTLIVFLRELAKALSNTQNSDSAIATYLEDYPSSALAQLLDENLQKRKLRLAADEIVQTFVSKEAQDCAPVRTFLHEIMAEMILNMILDKCSEADWLNEWLVYVLDDETKPEVLQRIGSEVNEEIKSPRLGVKMGLPLTGQDDSRTAKRLSKAEEAMQQAVREAEELSRMIAEEEQKKRKDEHQQMSAERPTTPKENGIDKPLDQADDTSNVRRTSTSSAGSSFSPGRLQRTFTSFDQLAPETLNPSAPPASRDPRNCLHNARIWVSELPPPQERGTQQSMERLLRSKPTSAVYMLQVEPNSSFSVPGWIVTRKYADFEALHEVLLQLAMISGTEDFTIHHSDIPTWKGVTQEQLRLNLEVYLHHALRQKVLAECEGMKKFFDKEGTETSPIASGNAFTNLAKGLKPQALKNVGEGVLGAIAKTPQEAAQGGKALFSGVSSVFGAISKRNSQISKARENSSIEGLGEEQDPRARISIDHRRIRSTGSGLWNPPQKPIYEPNGEDGDYFTDLPSRQSNGLAIRVPTLPEEKQKEGDAGSRRNSQSGRPEVDRNWTSPIGAWKRRASEVTEDITVDLRHLPPPPKDMPDDYIDLSAPSMDARSSRPPLPPRPVTTAAITTIGNTSKSDLGSSVTSQQSTPSTDASSRASSPIRDLPLAQISAHTTPNFNTPTPLPSLASRAPSVSSSSPITEQETQMILDLAFAVLSELFTLSSAWLLRRSLLNVAKNILLRPGNASLEATRVLIQESILDGNTSDQSIASYIRKLRENVFPTPEERESWQGGHKTKEEKDALKEKARRLMTERGLPEALRGVMGNAACRESMGNVFDCLQQKRVARGLVCGLMLEAIRGVCH